MDNKIENKILDECKKSGYTGYVLYLFGKEEDYVAIHGEVSLPRTAVYAISDFLKNEDKEDWKDIIDMITKAAEEYAEGKYGKR